MGIKKLSLISLTIIIVFLFVGCKEQFTSNSICCQIPSGENIKIFIVADPHYMSKKLFDNGEAFSNFVNMGDGKLIHYSEEIFDAFTYDLENHKPDILIVPGDLTCNGEKESHMEFSEKLKVIEKMGICILTVPGNHDIENPWARKYEGEELNKIDSITPKEFEDIYFPYGYKDAVAKDPNSLSYLSTPSEDLWILMLDSAKYKKNKLRDGPEMGGEISPKTLEWIRECGNLARENNAKLLAVLHHSLLDHSKVINENYTIDNNQDTIKVLQDCNVDLVLTGHIHLQDIKSHKENNRIIYDIATSCLSAYPNQYGVLEYRPNKGYYYKTSRVNIYDWAWVNEIEDKNITNFRNYSRDFFSERSYDRYYTQLLEISKYSNEEMAAISKTMSLLNLRYFSGFRNNELHDIFNTEGFEILLESAPNFVRDYALSMFSDEKTDNNKIFIPIGINNN